MEGFQCGLWLAPSTLPNAGLGVFNGAQPINPSSDKSSQSGLDNDQILLPLQQVEFHNNFFEKTTTRTFTYDQPTTEPYLRSDQLALNWRNYLMNYFINPKDFGWEKWFPDDTHILASGLGAIANCHFALNAIREPHSEDLASASASSSQLLQVDTAGLDPSDRAIGGFSHFHGYQAVALKEIPSHMELFGSYGHQWFEERVDSLFGGVPIPFEDDWKSATTYLQTHFLPFFKNYQIHLKHLDRFYNTTTRTNTTVEPSLTVDLWNLILVEDDEDFQESLQQFAATYNHLLELAKIHKIKTSFDSWHIPMDFQEDLLSVLDAALDLEFSTLSGLPDSWSEVQVVLQSNGGDLIQKEQEKSTRSNQWLHEQGVCMDTLRPGPSSIPRAGRGAFTKIAVAKGQVIAHTPLLHIADRAILNMHEPMTKEYTVSGKKTMKTEPNYARPIGAQLLLNYCFGHESSPVLLCPYGSTTPYINHHPTDFNAKIVWASNKSWFDRSCLELTPEELASKQYSSCLAVDYIATRDIDADEEILIDYGSLWHNAWEEYMDRRERPSAPFRFPMQLSDDLLPETWKRQDLSPAQTYQELMEMESSQNGAFEGADFVENSLRPGEVQSIHWRSQNRSSQNIGTRDMSGYGSRVSKFAVRVGLESKLTTTLMRYAERLGMIDLYSDLLQNGKALSPGTFKLKEMDMTPASTEAPSLEYYINRPESQWQSNMHWAGPANEAAHENFLRVLADANFDMVLEALGEYFQHVDGFFIQGAGFIGVSQCDKGFMHHDMTDTGGRFFNVLIPLVLVEGSPPELILQDDETKETGKISYQIDHAIVVGDDTYHGTAACHYDTSMRFGVSIYIADLNSGNQESILSDTTTIFPVPHDAEWANAQTGRHWRRKKSSTRQTHSLRQDPGRHDFNIEDKWDNCEALAAMGKCSSDVWEMRPNCVKTCGVYQDRRNGS